MGNAGSDLLKSRFFDFFFQNIAITSRFWPLLAAPETLKNA
jgi:hypothetical protein